MAGSVPEEGWVPGENGSMSWRREEVRTVSTQGLRPTKGETERGEVSSAANGVSLTGENGGVSRDGRGVRGSPGYGGAQGGSRRRGTGGVRANQGWFRAYPAPMSGLRHRFHL